MSGICAEIENSVKLENKESALEHLSSLTDYFTNVKIEYKK
jgi:hypothetical protein